MLDEVPRERPEESRRDGAREKLPRLNQPSDRAGRGSMGTPCTLVLDRIRRIRWADGVRCPRCGGGRVHRWGEFSGRQRYRCVGGAGCGRTFSDLTGTPAAYVKKLRCWRTFVWHLEEASTVRAAAADLGVAPSTTFRWRHLLLAELRRRDTDRVGGWVELGWLRILQSCKGQRRDLGRPARRRRPPGWSWLWSPRTMVAVALERESGQVVTAVVDGAERGRPGVAALVGALRHRVETKPPPDVMMTEGWLSPWSRFVEKELGGRCHQVGSRRSEGPEPAGGIHVRGQQRYGAQFRRWMRRFRGVATRYLPNYLIWHRRVFGFPGPPFRQLVMNWPLDPSRGRAEAGPG